MSKKTPKVNEMNHQDKIKNQDIQLEIAEKVREELLPNIQKKAEEVSRYIEKVLKEKDENGLTATQILPLIAKRSISDLATVKNKTYTPQELAIAFTIYMDMMQELNKYCKFPPSKGSFSQMLGISKETYNNYLQDPEKSDIMHIIDDYITTSILTSAQIGELREITSMFSLKAQHGFVEATTPIVIKHEKTTDIEDIQAQIKALKNKPFLEAELIEKKNQDE